MTAGLTEIVRARGSTAEPGETLNHPAPSEVTATAEIAVPDAPRTVTVWDGGADPPEYRKLRLEGLRVRLPPVVVEPAAIDRVTGTDSCAPPAVISTDA